MIEMHSVGVTKVLDEGERLVYTSSPTEILLLKQEVYTKIMGWEKIEKTESIFRGIIYLTDKRLIFLKLFEVPGVSSGQKKNLLVGSAGTFIDISLGKVAHIIKRTINLSKDNAFRFITVFGGDEHAISGGPALEIGYNEKTIHIKKDATAVCDLVLILGDPMFAIEPILTNQVKMQGSSVP